MVFIHPTLTPNFGLIVEFSHESKTTSFGHINMARRLFIYCYCISSKLRGVGVGGLYAQPEYKVDKSAMG